VPFQNFATANGWIVVACPKQKLWERLCRAIGRDDLLADPTYENMAVRNENRERLVPELDRTFQTKTTEQWLPELAAAGVPSGPVNDVATALRDPQVIARAALETYEHPRFGEVTRVRSPLRLTGHEPAPAPAPRRGEHTRTTLGELCGMSPAELDELEREGAFGAP
jgi:crotonobetainyl-CoA:carnitine CoA-transferase CaiB-like acyl-CoA transferase